MWPYILPLPEISQIAILLLYLINDCFESLWVADSEFGEDFAIDTDALLFHASDELRIGHAKFAGSVINTSDPESAKVAFAGAAVSVGILQSLDNALFAETVAAAAVVLHAFGGF